MKVATTHRIASEAAMVLALRDHYATPHYVLLPQVRNGTGFEATRTADALAMSVWPSRGLDLVGIEIKVSRSDWLREMRNPRKADEIASYCDFWVLAVGSEEIIQDGELPQTWGLLVPGKQPGDLRMKVTPERLTPKPISRTFLAAILRKTVETVVPLGEVEAEIQRRVDDRTANIENTVREKLMLELDREQLVKRNAELEDAVAAFQDATGLQMNRYRLAELKQYAKALEVLRWGSVESWVQRVQHSLANASKEFAGLEKALSRRAAEKETAA